MICFNLLLKIRSKEMSREYAMTCSGIVPFLQSYILRKIGTKQSAEFWQEAVRVALTSGLTQKQVASDFGMCHGTCS